MMYVSVRPLNFGLVCRLNISRWLINKYKQLLAPWSRVLLEKLTGFQLVKKFPAFYGIPAFITAFTSARHQPLS